MVKEADISEFESGLRSYLSAVENGDEILIMKGGVPLATLSPVISDKKVERIAGRYKGQIKILGNLDEPFIPLENWNMLKD